MSSNCKFIFNNFPITSTKEVEAHILSLFDKNDIKTYKRKVKQRIGWEIEDDDEEEETAIEFVSNGKIVKDRLEVIGFTLERVKDDFKLSVEEKIKFLEDFITNFRKKGDEEIRGKIFDEINLLKDAEFEEFVLAAKNIIDNNTGWIYEIEEVEKIENPISKFLLERNYDFGNFPYLYDERNLYRALLEYYPETVELKYDITNIALYDLEENELEEIDLYEYYVFNEEIPFEYQIGEKIIVLTEGSSDSRILKESLEILFPHLSQYFSFMDFGISNAPGSAGHLSNTVKSFVGAGIKNRVIAIYDNDTAGYSAIKGLVNTHIPNNIKIMNYPDIKLAENYPTIGPTGLSNQNINKLAVSIELYFGKDVLINGDDFVPIQWTGFDKGVGKYQGEVQNKTELQIKFFEKVKACKNNSSVIDNYDWEDMRNLLRNMFNIFNK